MSIFNVPDYLTETERKDADKWSAIANSKAGQDCILDAARIGDRSAINYLFIRSSAIIYTAFNSFVGFSEYHRNNRINEGDYYEFLSYAYQILLASAVKSGYVEGDVDEMDVYGSLPLDTFRSAVYVSDPTVDLIEKFKWFYLNSMRKTGQWSNRQRAKNGLTHVSVRENEELGCGNMLDIDKTDPDNNIADVVFSEVIKSEDYTIRKWKNMANDRRLRRGKSLTIAQCLKASLVAGADFSINDFSEQTGVSKCVYYSNMKKFGIILSEYDIDKEDFCNLLKVYGGENLADYL